MALETLTGTVYIDALTSTNPVSGDPKSEGDDHIRGIKNVLKTTFPNVTGAVTAAHTKLNYTDVTTPGTAQASKAAILDASRNIGNLGTVTATAFSGPLTGNVTGNVTGSSGSCTGNSATATTATNATTATTATNQSGGTVNATTATITTANLTDINWSAPTIKSQGSQSIAASGGNWTPPAGLYNFSYVATLALTGLNFELYISGAWRASIGSTIVVCDGTNMRFVNDSGAPITIYYQKMG